MEFKKMPDEELAKIMVNQINRVAHLKDILSLFLEKRDSCKVSAESIRELYKDLKNELIKDADYLNLVRNRNGSTLYMSAFSPSIREASAFGFNVPVNSKVDFNMFSAVEEAHYKLTKYKNLEEWGELM